MNIDVMSASYIQAERILRVESPLGFDVLLPQQMRMSEKMSGLFELSLSVHSKRVDLKPEELVGKLADVSLETGSGARRTWNGLVTELIEGPSVTRAVRAYKLILRPQHWLLTQRSDCRIWLDRTSVEVAQILMGEHKLLSPVTKGIITPPKPQHYSVQFNETDLDYLTRRLEEDGIFFWFEHEGGAPGSVCATHTLHLASDISGYVRGPDTDVRFAMGSSDRNHVTKFEKTFRYLPGKRAGGDWNFLTPSLVPGGSTPSLVKLPKNDAYELYQYPSLAGYGANSASEGIDGDAVERQSKLRMMSSEADHERIGGASTVRTLSPGRRFKPYDVANPENVFKEHVIVEIIHTARDNSYETNEGGVEYENTFTAIPAKVPATPHRTTRRPKIEGTQVALVAGPEGEEIHPDQYGRIKLWFPWDRRAKKDGSDTCWVRVAQSWAGAGFGGQIIPRIGMEVMVTHLDGDPDRPLVTGVVPNSRQKVPYKLPENKTKSVFRSNTHKGNSRSKFNELTFEDENGWEEIFIHAQKDRNEKTLNNHSERIDNNWVQSVGHNKSVEVTNNQSEAIGGSMNLTVGPGAVDSLVPSAMKGRVHGIGDVAALLGQPGRPNSGAGNMNVTVEKNKSETIGAVLSEQIGTGRYTTVGKAYEVTSGSSIAFTAGEKWTENIGQVKLVQAGSEISLSCGGTRFTMKANGEIHITGAKIFVNGKQFIRAKGGKIELN
jgi:type VI secretion system secreted protein VgrG